jgi:hypothetical protein
MGADARTSAPIATPDINRTKFMLCLPIVVFAPSRAMRHGSPPVFQNTGLLCEIIEW